MTSPFPIGLGTKPLSLRARRLGGLLRPRFAWHAAVLALLAGTGTLRAQSGPPVITSSPVAQTVFLGDVATFRVMAGGAAPLSYQWLCNGASVSGATASAYAFTTSSADHLAQFSVVVTNPLGAATSAPVALTIDFGMPGPVQTNRWLEVTNLWRYDVSKTDRGTT